jgi:hypothetical protein
MALPVGAGVLERELVLQGAKGKQQSTRWLVAVLLSLGGVLIVMLRLTSGVRSEKCVVRRFRRRATVRKCTYKPR